MFQYEYEKRPPSATSCDSRATRAIDWSRVYPNASRTRPEDERSLPNAGRSMTSVERARRPLPPRPDCDNIPNKTSVPLKVWVIASASCFAVCAALVLATVMIAKWETSDKNYSTHDFFNEMPEPVYSNPHPKLVPKTTTVATATDEISNDVDFLEKLPIFNNKVANRNKDKQNLSHKPQIHPIHDPVHHAQRKIEKKDEAKLPARIIPEFKPTLPDVFVDSDIKLKDGFVFKKAIEYDYYEDNLYEDYAESNSMTNYLIEKVQELHDWITTDPDLKSAEVRKNNSSTEFGQLLKVLNESLVEGNVTIIMNKLRDIYFGENYTKSDGSGKMILTNTSDLLSFGILTLDVMLLHNIQMMAWESQESARNRMMKDPNVFAFNALFLDPTKVEAKRNEVYNQYDNSIAFSRRQNHRQETIEDFDIGKNLLDNFLEVGMSTARAAIHLGRAYKNTKTVLSQISNKETSQQMRKIGGSSHAFTHLQTSYNDSSGVGNATGAICTELDCVWLLYCRNLAATAKLNAPYGTMARINGVALRMLTGELSAERALHTMLYEALAGWSDLNCEQSFPRCSKVDAASVVLDSILQPMRKSQATNRLR